MKLVFRGKYSNEEQLPKGVLPENAVRFIEPEGPKELNKKAGYKRCRRLSECIQCNKANAEGQLSTVVGFSLILVCKGLKNQKGQPCGLPSCYIAIAT